jgi:hypothetical protein
MVKTIPIAQNPPYGWRVLTIEEGREIKQQLLPLMDQWGIVAFKTGKLDGQGYGFKISESYGKECGNKFIIDQEESTSQSVAPDAMAQ